MRSSPLTRLPRLSFLRGGGSLRSQLIWVTATISTLVVVLLTVLVQLLLSSTTNAAVGQVLTDRADGVAAGTVQASTGQQLTVPQAQLDAGVAVYDASGHVVAGAVPERLSEQYERVRTVTSTRTIGVGDLARIHALGFTTKNGVRATVVVSERLAPYQESANYALIVTVGAGILLVAASTGLVAFASRRVLAPVQVMASTAGEWSEHDLTKRFGLGAPDNEITALGHTLDGLLDKVSAAIRSEQRLTSELAHELRTPLTAVQGNAQLLQLNPSLDQEARADLEDILAGCRRMATTISGLIDLARTASSMAEASTCSATDVVADVIVELDLSAVGGGLRIEQDVADGDPWSVPQQLAVRALTPIVSNAARHAETVVRLSLDHPAPGVMSVLVENDGPGIDPSLRDRIFRPGETSGAGAGLGLALSRRIARMTGGDVTLDESTRLTTFRLTLPAARAAGRTHV
jgi:signal transduction histidine kinase